MPQRTFEVEGAIISITIQASAPSFGPADPSLTYPRLLLEGIIKDSVTGDTLRRFSEDVTDQLNATALSQVTAIVARAQTWVNNRATT